MRLLNTTPPLLAKEFNESELPAYAILSHTWEEEEVLFSDLPLLANIPEKNPTHAKILRFCDLARAQGYQYAWVDTCCIDKTSTAELGEAINSMYRWYQKAGICHVYLSDYQPDRNELEDCRWFKRGWTLQELIAPSHIRFYDKEWHFVGTKTQLRSRLCAITGIDEKVLAGASPDTCSIAERMSWAAGRDTARMEDRAYSLLGLFDVSLPLLYGISSTRNAFIQMQEVILKESDDQSIFAWGEGFPEQGRGHCGLLADSPDAFADCRGIIPSPSSHLNPRGFGLTNVGLTLNLQVYPWSMYTYVAILDCTFEKGSRKRRGILVERLADETQYARIRVNGITTVMVDPSDPKIIPWVKERQICVRQKPGPRLHNRYGFWIRTLRPPGFSNEELQQAKIWTLARENPLSISDEELRQAEAWTQVRKRHFPEATCESTFVEIPLGCSGTVAIAYLPLDPQRSNWCKLRWLKVAFDKEFNPMCILGNEGSLWRTNTDSATLGFSHEQFAAEAARASNSRTYSELFHSRWIGTSPIIKLGETADHYTPQNFLKTFGTCILEGKSGHSWDINLYALNINVSMRPEKFSPPPLSPEGDTGCEWQIWTLDINWITVSKEDVPREAIKLYEDAQRRTVSDVSAEKSSVSVRKPPHWTNF